MTYAYDKLYLPDAQSNLATMLDYAVYSLKYELKFFFDMFLQSSISKKFADGDASVIAGKSGVELARAVVEENTNEECFVPYESSFQKSPEYWTGWALAYYQWYSGVDFSVIDSEVSIDDICLLYRKYHEMDISHFVNRMNEMRMEQRCMTFMVQNSFPSCQILTVKKIWKRKRFWMKCERKDLLLSLENMILMKES